VLVARTDVVGSLLRPPELLLARERWDRGELGPPEFKRVEDAAVDSAIRLQEDAGLAVVTDGEMRRLAGAASVPPHRGAAAPSRVRRRALWRIPAAGHGTGDKTAVLGLVTTKTGRRETVDELETRIREAARYQPLEHLALSPQCGFATSILGNALSIADEEAKLRTIVATAERVWG
jgi:methionine synthase II (cobalamin-independent)